MLREIYDLLLGVYGPQGWWPLLDVEGTNPTATGSFTGYHPEDYDYPKGPEQKFEIWTGAILTQNTSWIQVEKVLFNLKKEELLDPQKILHAPPKLLLDIIRPAGYFNQKSAYLIESSEFFLNLEGEAPERNQLLAVKGIGEETADSILLYAYGKPEFVIDTYTRRILTALCIIEGKESYSKIKSKFESSLTADVAVYQEYHALLVEHAKRFYSKRPWGVDDPLSSTTGRC
jgi:endonuclease III related protein